jgi:hypothetical protein
MFLLMCGVGIIIGVVLEKLKFVYMPIMFGAKFDIWQAGLFVLYFTLCAMPIIINIKGDLEWRAINNKTKMPVSSLKI